MNRPLLLALAAISLTRAEAALAGSSSCGGGGGDSGSGSGSGGSDSGGSGWGSSDDSSASSSSDSSSTPACVDETDIVGYRRCTKFGSWSAWHMPLFFLELGSATRTFGSPLDATTGHVTHDAESFSYRVMGKPPAAVVSRPETAVVATARLGFGLSHGIYLAAEGEVGGLTRTSAASRAEMTSTGTFGAPSITHTSSLVAAAHAVAGIQGAVGPGSLGAEIAGGVRSITHYYESRYLACVTTTAHGAAMPVLEARARASYWLTPFISVGATAGASLVDRGAWVGGLHLGFATQAYGGQRD